MLILVEGGDGSGKSTLVETLRKFNFKIAKPAALQNKHQFEYYERLALQSIYAEQNVILDRSFLSELVYRIYDKKKPRLKLGEIFSLLKYCKIILCETGTQFQDAIARGEDNITKEEDSRQIKFLYRQYIALIEQFENVPVLRYNWQKNKMIEIISFINQTNTRR